MRLLFSCLAGAVFTAAIHPLRADTVALDRLWATCNIQRPVSVVIPPDGSQRLFLVQQRGLIRILSADRAACQTKPFLDFTGRKMEENDFEEGLLGLAFHPQFKTNGRFFVYYSQQDPKRSVVSELKVSAADPDKADAASERILMEVPQPYWNHNSGNMLFGADGMLYIALGDGGKAHDPLRTAQNPFLLYGKILRIDVDTRSGARGYGIPKDNPWVKQEGMRPEVWATGLRNPWGLAFDRVTGLFWCADVGQDIWEEVNIIEKGGNYGWSYREGAHPFVQRKDPPPDGVKFIDPIIDYPHSEGTSVTGGFVYRGKAVPSLHGMYLYGDYGTGFIRALRYDPATKKVTANETIVESKLDAKKQALLKPTAFCEDNDGEILVLDWNGGIFTMRAMK